MARAGRIVQLKKGPKGIEGTLRQSRFGADVSFEAPLSMKAKLKLGTIVEFAGLPRKPQGRTVGERKVKITKVLK